MLSKLKKSKGEGFTIIEVMIVLAIAGLILLIVFLAVPALQRNARNTQRKSDASRLSSAADNFVSNNNGTLPNTAADAATIVTDAGTLGQYGALTGAGAGGTACAAASLTNAQLFLCKGAAVTFTALGSGQDGVVLAVKAQCGTGGAIVVGTAKQMAEVYTLETQSGTSLVCINL